MVKREEAVLAGPNALTKGFAETCSSVMPEAKINKANKNRPYIPMTDAG